MAQYTVINDTDLEIILKRYGIGNIQSYKILSGGSENTNYLVEALSKSFVLTICEQKSAQEAENLALLLNDLKLQNFSTSKLVATLKGAFTTQWNDKPVILKEFIEGTIIQDFSEDLLLYLGRELAKLHQVNVPDYVPRTLNYGSIERFDEVKVYAPNSSFYRWLKNTQCYIEDFISPELPKSLIHSDIFYSNVIVSEDRKVATIMDFEEACYYYRVFDIGMMIVGICFEGETINQKKMKSLLEGYQQENKLLEIEIYSLKAFTVYAATATAFWRHQNFNYVNVDATLKDHYLEMKNLADTIMNRPTFYK
jgi:homoserine kinase type II